MVAAVASFPAAGRSCWLSRVSLSDFRCYAWLRLELDDRPVILTGANGAGKTNILEAISLLAPGRGLRGAELVEMKRGHPAQDKPFAVAVTLEQDGVQSQIGVGLDSDDDDDHERRIIKIDGRIARGQVELAEQLSLLWLTPQMDRLWQDGPGARRKFLDRLVFSFDPAHAGRLSRYERAQRERMKLLKDGARQPSWLDGLEAIMAETGIAIAAARADVVHRLQRASGLETQGFPSARVALEGEIDQLLLHSSALAAEEYLRRQLTISRATDAAQGVTQHGVHRSDLLVSHAEKDIPAAQCSTGEQKALLIAITLLHARLLQAERGQSPMLLLDDITAHLDRRRREALFQLLAEWPAQSWLSGVDAEEFYPLQGHGQFFAINHGNALVAL